MVRSHRTGALRGPPLVLQILLLLLGGLVVAQAVTLALTLVLPPAPTQQHQLDAVAAALRGQPIDENRSDRLVRKLQADPPDISGPSWLVSDHSQRELATLLDTDIANVRLAFYTPLPFAGTAAPRRATEAVIGHASPLTAVRPVHLTGVGERPPYLILAAYDPAKSASRQGRSAPSRMTDLPSDVRAAGTAPSSTAPSSTTLVSPGVSAFGIAPPFATAGSSAVNAAGTVPSSTTVVSPGVSAFGIAPPPATAGSSGVNAVGAGLSSVPSSAASSFSGVGAGSSAVRPSGGLGPWVSGPAGRSALVGPDADERPAATPVPVDGRREQQDSVGPPASARPDFTAAAHSPVLKPKAVSVPIHRLPPPVAPAERRTAPVVPVRTPERGLFGLALAPFVEGDFVAAWRMPNGQWSVVQPVPAPFPNSWQRRVLIWFAVSFALTAPFGWLFARRIVKPLSGFVEAAELLGRDPAAVVHGLDGPAEVGRAARAFNRMQSRLKSFVDDRTAMVGAISHDLRTPLTRLRFRIEDVESESMRDGMIGEVEEMEQMITSVLAFIRDASTPGVRERLDLRSILDEVVRNVTLIGGDATVEAAQPAPVEVDILGIRRLMTNLVENAVKYGERARIRLRIDLDCAVAEVTDDGPGLPEDELERVFEPFYRATNAAGKQGNGLGLAVCRSIARAHGGDVRLLRSERGFVAQLRIPLYDAA